MTQPVTLRLADALMLERPNVKAATRQDAAAELRRLHEVNQELIEALEELLRVEATHDDGEIILEVARHNARAALAKARGME